MSIAKDILILMENSSTITEVEVAKIESRLKAQSEKIQKTKMLMLNLNLKADAMIKKTSQALDNENMQINKNVLNSYIEKLNGLKKDYAFSISQIEKRQEALKNFLAFLKANKNATFSVFSESQKKLIDSIDLNFDYREEPKPKEVTPILAPLTSPQHKTLSASIPRKLELRRGDIYQFSKHIDQEMMSDVYLKLHFNKGCLKIHENNS